MSEHLTKYIMGVPNRILYPEQGDRYIRPIFIVYATEYSTNRDYQYTYRRSMREAQLCADAKNETDGRHHYWIAKPRLLYSLFKGFPQNHNRLFL